MPEPTTTEYQPYTPPERREEPVPPERREEPPPEEPLITMDPVLMNTLEALDRDVTGELKFCHQAADALRSFQARWAGDVAVEGGYGTAITALDNMRSILSGAQSRTTQEVTRKVLGRKAAVQEAATAKVAREHALSWAETPPPPASVPEAKPGVATDDTGRPVPPEAGVIA